MRALIALIAAIVLPAAPLSAPAASFGDDVGIRFRVGIWAPAMETATAGSDVFANVTIRNVVYASSGGTAPRVRVSNRWGTVPLVVGHVDLAEQSIGGVAKTGSHHRMTFGGLGSVTIPSGEEWVSDPADMTVVSGQNLLISIYLPESTGPATMHHAALMNTYVSGPGNHAEDDSSADFPGRRWSWYFFSGLDVVSSTAVGTIVAFGDSITDGYSSSHLMNRRYPDYLARRIAAQPGGPKLGVVNAGMANNMVLRDRGPNTNGGPSALNRFEHDALSHESVRSVILLEGVNDIMADATAAQLQEGYRQLVAKAHARGVKVYGATILPFGGFSSHTPAREAVRQELNDWIRAGNVFDGFFDFDAKVCDPNDRTKLRDVYAHGDSLHLTDAGMSALADTVDLHMINPGSLRQPTVKPCWELAPAHRLDLT